MLHEFVAENREEIICRCRAKVAARSVPPPTQAEIDHGVPLFLDQLVDALRLGLCRARRLATARSSTGTTCCFRASPCRRSCTIMATSVRPSPIWRWSSDAPISTDDFRTLNRCLDDAIAGAVTEYGRERDQSTLDEQSARGSERLGFLAHELRNLVNTARPGVRGPQDGQRGRHREHRGRAPSQPDRVARADRPIAGRGPAHAGRPESGPFEVSDFVNDLAHAATLEANACGVTLTVLPVQQGVAIDADRQVLTAVRDEPAAERVQVHPAPDEGHLAGRRQCRAGADGDRG